MYLKKISNGIGGQYYAICNKDTIQNTTVIEQTSKIECVPQFVSEVENKCLIMNKDFEFINFPFSYVYKDKKCYSSTIISNFVQAINYNGTIQCEQCQLGYLLSANKLQYVLQTLQYQYLIKNCVECKDSENCQKCDFGYN